jgi:hypothetical protein
VQVQPIVVDLGKKKKKQIRNLKRGRGPLLEDVADVVEKVRASLPEQLAGKELVPVVIVYRQKKKRSGGLLSF